LDFITDDKENKITKIENSIPILIQNRMKIWTMNQKSQYEVIPAIQANIIKLNQKRLNKMIDLMMPLNCVVLFFRI